jgi:RNA polymerase sigma-70 factor (ECF subfamily)
MHQALGGGEASDGELARRVAAGGRGAAEAESELCRRLAPRVRLYGLRHLRDAAAADDLVQEVLVLTLERLRAGRVRDPDRLASFVFGACRLVVRNLRRGRRRREDLLGRFAFTFPQTTTPDALALDRGRLRECLARLAERERTVLVLTFYAEQPSAEIAARLGTSPENVRTVRHRAFGRLRDCVKGADA